MAANSPQPPKQSQFYQKKKKKEKERASTVTTHPHEVMVIRCMVHRSLAAQEPMACLALQMMVEADITKAGMDR